MALVWSLFGSACGHIETDDQTQSPSGKALPKAEPSQGAVTDTTVIGPIIWDVAFSRDGRWVFAGGDDGMLTAMHAVDLTTMRVLDLQAYGNGQPVFIHRLRWHPGRPVLAIATSGGMPGAILDLAADTLRVLDGMESFGSRALAWSADGRQLGNANYDKAWSLWDPEGQLIRQQAGLADKSFVGTDAHPERDEWLLLSERITHLDANGRVLDTVRHRPENVLMLCVRWHPSGTFYAVGDYGDEFVPHAPLLQFRAPDGTLLKTMDNSRAEYRNLDWSPDGERLATASDKLRIWSKDGDLLFAGDSPAKLWGVHWSSDGSRLATSDEAGHVSIWDAQAQLLLTRSLP